MLIEQLKPTKALPVMVYIFGGAFAGGEPYRSSWGPDYFMMKDVILITIGFRVGAFGTHFYNFKTNKI